MLGWILVLGLLAGGVYAAVEGRYEYFTEGTAQLRRDRLTGAVQRYECVALYVQGTESAYFPMASDRDPPRQCARYGWRTRR